MGFFDDLKDKFKTEADKGLMTIQEHLKTKVVDAVVKIGQPKTGNLNQAQLDAGARGGTSQIAPVEQVQAYFSNQANYPMIAGIAIGLWFLFGKKRRG